MSRRPFLAVLALVLSIAALALLFRDRLVGLLTGAGGGASPEAAVEAWPEGFWHWADWPPGRAEPRAQDAEERARFLSLPYLGGRAPAAGREGYGVVRHDPERALPGLNLYTSGHGPEAILMDMAGRTVHRWRYPFERAFPGVAPTSDTGFFRRAQLLPDDRLLVLYQTGGLALLDRRSRLLARCRGNFYNDFWVGEDGRIWTLGKEVEGDAGGGERLDDFLVLLRLREADGACREERRISLTRAFERSPFAGLLDPRAPAGDVLHSNTVAELDGSLAALSPLFARGHLLVSLREIDTVAIVDPEAARVVWGQRGPWRRQHEPSLLSSGRILLFDNHGLGGHSRLVEVDPRTGAAETAWGGDPPESFRSPVAGTVARLSNGNTLVTESVPGRAFELDPEGRIAWEFLSPHRAGPEDRLVAMLFEVTRLPLDALEPVR